MSKTFVVVGISEFRNEIIIPRIHKEHLGLIGQLSHDDKCTVSRICYDDEICENCCYISYAAMTKLNVAATAHIDICVLPYDDIKDVTSCTIRILSNNELQKLNTQRIIQDFLNDQIVDSETSYNLGSVANIDFQIVELKPNRFGVITTATVFVFQASDQTILANSLCSSLTKIFCMESVCKQLSQTLFDISNGRAMQCGILIQGGLASGKSHLLAQIHQAIVPSSILLDLSQVFDYGRGEVVSAILRSYQQATRVATCSPSEVAYLLLDNLDGVVQVSDAHSTSSSLDSPSGSLRAACTSLLCQVCLAIASTTCTNSSMARVVIIATTSKDVHGSLTQPYRFGKAIKIAAPDKESRRLLFRSLLGQMNDTCTCQLNVVDDVKASDLYPREAHTRLKQNGTRTISHLEALSDMCARYSQGYTVADILSAVSYLHHSAHDPSPSVARSERKHFEIRTSKVLKILNQVQPSGVVLSASQHYVRDLSASPSVAVYGYEDILQSLYSTAIKPLLTDTKSSHDHIISRFNIRPCSGILVHGPSGCGKSSLSLALGQMSAGVTKFMSVSCAEIIHKVVGESEKKLSDIFAAARSMSPCFLLLDNIEVLFSMTPNSSQSDRSAEDTRGDGGGGVGGLGGRRRRRGAHRTSHAAIDRILSTLLVEIDGVKSPSSRSNANRVIVIATTCLHPREFDSALTRPGRLEEHVEMALPSRDRREAMIRSLLQDSGIYAADGDIVNQDLLDIAKKLTITSEGSTCAEIKDIVTQMSMENLRRRIEASAVR